MPSDQLVPDRRLDQDYPAPEATRICDYIHITDLAQALALEAAITARHVSDVGNDPGFSDRKVFSAAEGVDIRVIE